jgi:hypothetical protein
MNRKVLLSLLVILAGSGLAAGQYSQFATAAPPATKPGTTTEAAPPVPPGVVTPPAPLLPPAPIGEPCLGGPAVVADAGLRYLTADANFAVWFFPGERRRTSLAVPQLAATIDDSTNSFLGDRQFDGTISHGGIFSVGYWEAEPNAWVPGRQLRTWGVEGKFFFAAERSRGDRLANAPILLRPFFDLNNNGVSGVVVAAPGVASGVIETSSNGAFWGADLNLWQNVFHNAPGTNVGIDLLTGFRYLNLRSAVSVRRETIYDPVILAPAVFIPFAGNRIQEQEAFLTHNHFYGVQLGVAGNLYVDWLKVTGRAQIGLGGTHQSIRVEGSQLRTFPNGATQTSQGALLALGSNIGQDSRDRFTYIPELGVDFEVPLMSGLTLNLGFNALYWSRVVLAGEQIDRTIDVTQIPNFPQGVGSVPTGIARPSVPFKESGMWILAASVGMEYRW